MTKSETPNGPKVVPDSKERIILNRFTRIGDRVMMAVPTSDEGWSKRAVVNGTQGTVIGIKRYTHYQSRIGVFKEAPGHYECNGATIVMWDNGVPDTPSAHDIVFLDNSIKDSRQNDKTHNEAYAINQRIGDLPSLPFWELDIVGVSSACGRKPVWEDNPELIISSIDYHCYGQMCDDGVTPMAMYTVEPRSRNRGRVSMRESDLFLIRRGNTWNWENDRSKMDFRDLQEEVGFHKTIGLANEIVCPDTGNYAWPKESVLKYARQGMIDVLSSYAFFGGPPTVHAYKMTDPDLSKRANATLISGFQGTELKDDSSPKTPASDAALQDLASRFNTKRAKK